MPILSQELADYYYSRISDVNNNEELSYEEKIRKVRNILESVFKELTSNENMFFSDLHARMVYIFDKYQVSERTIKKLHSVSKYLIKLYFQRSF